MNKASSFFVGAVVLLLFGLARNAAQNAGSDAKATIDAAAAAMGTTALRSIQYTGMGQFMRRVRPIIQAVRGRGTP